ncbi:hypothetical protein M438DRAFT_346336 [Aureobasidium pullulans EXF-150]|uniref:BTB domain-containing protein n=1 Tax=Aureobasidium pullulans EXF-150 TaxID=1043002 RepID=A0A074XCY7_AURPU|nr:uncharacterized protein M438DRAFT_346336 [Aureobasidium pullulans EXF-150]KEQ83385.1 hypothetical protein M438DRAFT_346336 [Aureobasidium pullulans EXF-150]
MKPFVLQSIHKMPPKPPARERMRQLNNLDAFRELDSRLQWYREYDNMKEEESYSPSVPSHQPGQASVDNDYFGWTADDDRFAQSTLRRRTFSRKHEEEEDDFERDRAEDLRYNAIAEKIRATHSRRAQRPPEHHANPRDSTIPGAGQEHVLIDRFQDSPPEIVGGDHPLTQDSRQRLVESLDRYGGERGRGIPDAEDSYIADPPLSVMRKSREMQTVDDTSFLSMHAEGGEGTLTVMDPYTHKTTVLKNLNLVTIALVSPVLAFSFEESRSGPKCSIEDTSLAAVICMLRHIYTCEHYVPNDCLHDQMSVLLHIEIFHLASVYDISSLKTMVKARIFLELELSTSYPGPPNDLCKALAYAYKHLPNENDITKTLAHYCITCFLQHRLNEDELFTTFHYNCRPFQRDLCVILRENSFEDESAPTLIQLPVKTSFVPTRWPVVFDADPQGTSALEDEFDNEVKRRTDISRLDKLKIHFRVTLPTR